jgi:uncharacterized membrane protein YraQ (UPF0718 family)
MPDWGLFFGEILEFLFKCFSANVLTGLIPAFLIAGAVNVFIPPALIFRYFGAKTNKVLAYAVATISGIVISV